MIAGVAVLCVLSLAAPPSAAQAPAYRAPRTANGKPELSGIWQALNTADWDLEGQAAAAGPVPSLGAVFAKPPGLGVVEGDEIPYLPAMAAKKKENQADWVKLDPEVKCYLPGVPRATYLPYPFQIVQSQNNILISYEYAGAVRIINMGAPTKAPADSWMGWSNGHWEGETLVVDSAGFNDKVWIDSAGHPTSESLHIQERFRRRDFGHMDLQITIDDPKMYTKPVTFKVTQLLLPDSDILEYFCTENEKDRAHISR